MEQNISVNILNSLIAGIKQIAKQSNDSLRLLETSNHLSPMEHRCLSTAKLSSLYINRLCNTVSYLTNSDTYVDPKMLESFEIEHMMQDIIDTFRNVASGFGPIEVSFNSKLNGCDSILLSKSHFELVILNLLYCCIKSEPGQSIAPVKILVSATENKDYIVFHIYDNNKSISLCELNTSLSDALIDLGNPDNSSAALMALSLEVAKKSTEEMNGKLNLTRLKGGNRCDVYLPKFAASPACKMCSPTRYIPDYIFFSEVFADISLEHILTKVIETFEWDFKEVIKR